MAWSVPTLSTVRRLVRDNIAAKLPGADGTIANSVLRVMADAKAALAYMVLLYISWVAKQLLPDTAESEWLDRHANIWIDGRHTATFASGLVTVTGTNGTILPTSSRLTGSGVEYETTSQITVGVGATPVNVQALTAGKVGNQDVGVSLQLVSPPSGVNSAATVVSLVGGVDEESDDSLRDRVLARIRKPPMGGDADDYVAWAREVPGVTRAWAAPNEMGIGTVTVRFMMDNLRATTNPLTDGFPLAGDITTVAAYLDTKRPVAVKDFFVVAPIPEPINYTVSGLDVDTAATRAALEASVAAMIAEKGAPGSSEGGVLIPAQTIYREWVSAAILDASGVDHFDLTMVDHVMPDNGHIAVQGTATYV